MKAVSGWVVGGVKANQAWGAKDLIFQEFDLYGVKSRYKIDN
jgi:hypothetical protein